MIKAFVGDSHAVVSDVPEATKYFVDFYTNGIRGLPVWDIELEEILDSHHDYEKIFLSPATELHGGLRKFLSVQKLQPGEFINFQEEERYCFKKKYQESISLEYRLILLEKYINQIEYLLNKYKNITLVPLAAAFMLPMLPEKLHQPSTYQILCQRYGVRCLDLKILNKPYFFRDDMNHLSVQGYFILKQLFDSHVEVQ